jgi:AAA15 family ATPase/GTPase
LVLRQCEKLNARSPKHSTSILSRKTLGLAANDKDDHPARNVAPAGHDFGGVLRSAVIYGPNAAGTSNLLRALQTLQLRAVNSAVAT